jgi:hypothetical protein
VHWVLQEGAEGLLVQRLLVVNGHKRLLLQDVVEAGCPLAAAQASGVAAGQEQGTESQESAGGCQRLVSCGPRPVCIHYQQTVCMCSATTKRSLHTVAVAAMHSEQLPFAAKPRCCTNSHTCSCPP